MAEQIAALQRQLEEAKVAAALKDMALQHSEARRAEIQVESAKREAELKAALDKKDAQLEQLTAQMAGGDELDTLRDEMGGTTTE